MADDNQKTPQCRLKWTIVGCLVFLLVLQTLASFSFVMTRSPTREDKEWNPAQDSSQRQSWQPRRFSSSANTRPLQELTRASEMVDCPENLKLVMNTDLPKDGTGTKFNQSRKIPRIVHMTSKSRCVTNGFVPIVDSWRCKRVVSYVLEHTEN